MVFVPIAKTSKAQMITSSCLRSVTLLLLNKDGGLSLAADHGE